MGHLEMITSISTLTLINLILLRLTVLLKAVLVCVSLKGLHLLIENELYPNSFFCCSQPMRKSLLHAKK